MPCKAENLHFLPEKIFAERYSENWVKNRRNDLVIMQKKLLLQSQKRFVQAQKVKTGGFSA